LLNVYLQSLPDTLDFTNVMPIIKSAIKRNRQAAKRRSHNLKVRALVKQDVKDVVTAVEAGDASGVAKAFQAAQSEIDRAVKKGTLHRNTAARRKSRLSAFITRSLGETPVVTKTKVKPATAKKAAAKKPVAKKPAAKKTTTKK
jgi:small subunit ribosomal protein S20